MGLTNKVRLDKLPDCVQTFDDYKPTFVKYVGSNLILTWGQTLKEPKSRGIWRDSTELFFFSADDLTLVAKVSCHIKPVKVFSAVGSQKDIFVACENKVLIFGKKDLTLKKQLHLDKQPASLDEDG